MAQRNQLTCHRRLEGTEWREQWRRVLTGESASSCRFLSRQILKAAELCALMSEQAAAHPPSNAHSDGAGAPELPAVRTEGPARSSEPGGGSPPCRRRLFCTNQTDTVGPLRHLVQPRAGSRRISATKSCREKSRS